MLSTATTSPPRTGDQTLVREINRSIVLNALRNGAPISRAQLAAVTWLTKATVSSLVKELQDAQFVREIGLGKNASGGRPAIMLELNPCAGCMIGVEVGSDFISLVLTDFAATILWRRREPLDRFSPEDVLRRVVALARDALTHAVRDRQPVLGLGLGVPGLRTRQSHSSRHSAYLSWWDVPLPSAWGHKSGFPVYVDSQVNLAVIGETYWGAARGCQNVLYLHAGQTLAVAIVLNGRLLTGTLDPAGDVGHMTIDVDGPVCHCGHRGCWETFATESAVIRRVRQAIADGKPTRCVELAHGDSNTLTIGHVVEAARTDDPVALDALKETGRYLGIGLVNLINVFNPERIVLGGNLSPANDFLLPAIHREMARRATLWSRRARVLPAAHGVDACVMGGIAMVYQHTLHQLKLTHIAVRSAPGEPIVARGTYD